MSEKEDLINKHCNLLWERFNKELSYKKKRKFRISISNIQSFWKKNCLEELKNNNINISGKELTNYIDNYRKDVKQIWKKVKKINNKNGHESESGNGWNIAKNNSRKNEIYYEKIFKYLYGETNVKPQYRISNKCILDILILKQEEKKVIVYELKQDECYKDEIQKNNHIKWLNTQLENDLGKNHDFKIIYKYICNNTDYKKQTLEELKKLFRPKLIFIE